MTNKEVLEEVKRRLVDVYTPEAIYLFGSYAWGMPSRDSDLDLLIVVDKSDEKSYKRPIAGHQALFGMGLSKDIIVYTKEEFDRIASEVTTLEHKIKREGKLIYARA